MYSYNKNITLCKIYDKKKFYVVYTYSEGNKRGKTLIISKKNKIIFEPEITNENKIFLKGRFFYLQDIMNTLKIIDLLGYYDYEFYLSDNIKKPLLIIIKNDKLNRAIFGFLIKPI